MYFVWVSGTPGIGKSFICTMLKSHTDVVCYDADDIYAEIWQTVMAVPGVGERAGRDPRLGFSRLFYDEQDRIIDRIRDPRRHLVVVGITVRFEARHLRNRPDVEIGLGIVWSPDAMRQLYRRYMLREVGKLEQTLPQLQRIIEQTPLEEVDRLAFLLKMQVRLAGQFPRDFYEYQHFYIDSVVMALKDGVVVMTQDEAVQAITKLLAGELPLDQLKGQRRSMARSLRSPFLPSTLRAVRVGSNKKPRRSK